MPPTQPPLLARALLPDLFLEAMARLPLLVAGAGKVRLSFGTCQADSEYSMEHWHHKIKTHGVEWMLMSEMPIVGWRPWAGPAFDTEVASRLAAHPICVGSSLFPRILDLLEHCAATEWLQGPPVSPSSRVRHWCTLGRVVFQSTLYVYKGAGKLAPHTRTEMRKREAAKRSKAVTRCMTKFTAEESQDYIGWYDALVERAALQQFEWDRQDSREEEEVFVVSQDVLRQVVLEPAGGLVEDYQHGGWATVVPRVCAFLLCLAGFVYWATAQGVYVRLRLTSAVNLVAAVAAGSDAVTAASQQHGSDPAAVAHTSARQQRSAAAYTNAAAAADAAAEALPPAAAVPSMPALPSPSLVVPPLSTLLTTSPTAAAPAQTETTLNAVTSPPPSPTLPAAPASQRAPRSSPQPRRTTSLPRQQPPAASSPATRASPPPPPSRLPSGSSSAVARLATPAAAAAAAAAEEEEDNTCCVCLDAPRTVALLHGRDMHLCLCAACAGQCARVGGACPMRGQPVERIVTVDL